ncbi:MAG: transposase [Planctomycetes bacterium]|nr:transposase [Planctomycetota bacterium]
MEQDRENEPPMPEPLAYFLTWSSYGTWLPGDDRGWVEYRHGWRPPDPVRKLEAAGRMTEDACLLDHEQRQLVERQIAETCRFRGWELHAVNCRSNHVHVVVTADKDPKAVRNDLKAWCTRRLKELETARRRIPVREN